MVVERNHSQAVISEILPYRLPRIKNRRLQDPHVVIVGAGASIAACRLDKNGMKVPLLKNMDSLYEDNMVPMFVATNSKKVNGAGVILYDGLLRTFAEKIGGDFFILPSSVHEVIFVPANGDIDARHLIQMVKEVNATEVAPDEVLSDNVYMYHADEDFVEMM